MEKLNYIKFRYKEAIANAPHYSYEFSHAIEDIGWLLNLIDEAAELLKTAQRHAECEDCTLSINEWLLKLERSLDKPKETP
jgi:hypothetical protein